MPLHLSDEELVHILQAAQPLDRDRRGEFLEAIAAELARCTDPGPGDVFRAIRTTQASVLGPTLGAADDWRLPRRDSEEPGRVCRGLK
jgi:hypothetical protein